MPRLFTAIDLAKPMRQRALELIEQLRPSGQGIKWATEAQMHITLKFLGEVPDERVEQVQSVVASAAREFEPFEIEVAGVGAFPGLKRPNILWLGVREGADSLDKLFRVIQRPLVKLRVPREERRYTPHLTLGRLKHGLRATQEFGEALQAYGDYSAGVSLVSEVVLYESQLLPSGPLYHPIIRAPLARA